jgi:VWFA-related protein
MKGLAVAVALMAFLQTARERQQLPSVFKSGVDVVQLDVSVVNRNGAPVRGLTAADFIVTDNDARQEVRSVVVDQLALNVQLVLDVSSSVSGRRLARLVAATNGLRDALRPGDGAGLVMFSHLLRAPVEITEDLAVVRSALGGIVGDGRTALRDAIQLAIAKRDDGVARRLVLVFTDGVDNASWLSEEAVVDSARRAPVVIHVVRVRGQEPSSSTLVEQVTETTGGRLWSAASEDDLERLFTRALDEMRARYLLTFSPMRPVRPGWHELKVRLRGGGGEITARRGYFVVAPD